MIRSLRKRHLNIWIILALLLPIGFIWAYRVIPQDLPDPLAAETASAEKLFLVKRTKGANAADQLEITVTKPLTTPSTLVYLATKSSEDIKTAILIGSLGPQGSYHLNLPSPLPPEPVILFYNAISREMYHKVDFP